VNTLLWVVLPYTALTVFVLGHAWRWRTDQFGWSTHTSQLLESRILRLGSPLFHLGMLMVVGGHALGLLVPASWTEAVGVSADAYHWVSLVAGGTAGVMLTVGLALLVARRFVNGRVRRVTTRMDRVLYVWLTAVILLGMSTKVGSLMGHGHEYRGDVAVWFRGIFALDPSAELMASAPLVYQLHALAAFGLFALWPFTRLVHVFSIPLAYLWRPYVVYRKRPEGAVFIPPQVPRPAVHHREPADHR
jgi:nitrate reductase gamma subunit